MRILKSVMAAMLALTLVLTGCAGGNTSWVFRSGDAQLSPGLYIMHQLSAFSSAIKIITEENKDNPDFALAKTSDALKMTVEGTPAADWINAKAQTEARQYFAVLQKFNSMGLTLDESELATVESGVQDTMKSSKDFYDRNDISEVSIREYHMNFARYDKLFLTLYGDGGEFAVSQGDLENYFKDKFALIDIILMYKPYAVPEGETKSLEELTAEVSATAQDYLKRLQAGEAIEELAYEWMLKSASEEQKEGIQRPQQGELSMLVSEGDRANFGDAITDAALKSKIGVPEIIEEDDGIIVFNRVDSLADPAIFEGYRKVALRQFKYDEFGEKLIEWGANIELEQNQAAISRYKPSKLKVDAASSSAQ